MRELERQLDYQLDIGLLLALKVAPMKQEYLQEQADLLLSSLKRTLQPWLFTAAAATTALRLPDMSNPEEVESYYRAVVENSRKRRALKKQLEEEDANG